MQFDWITVSAQIVNFLVLVWLLKRFLYQPVIRAMDAREQRIAGRLAEAGEREQEADEEARQLRAERQELEGRRDEILEGAREDAAERKRELLDEARREVDKRREKWLEQVEREQQASDRELRRSAGDALLSAMRSALRDLADADLDAQVVEGFLRQVAALDAEARRAFAAGEDTLVVSTAFELDDEQRTRLRETLQEAIAPEAEVRFRHSPELIAGIQVEADGRRLGWNLRSYVDEVAARMERPSSVGRQGTTGEDRLDS